MSIKAIKNIQKSIPADPSTGLGAVDYYDIIKVEQKTDEDGVVYKERTFLRTTNLDAINRDITVHTELKQKETDTINDLMLYKTKIEAAQAK